MCDSAFFYSIMQTHTLGIVACNSNLKCKHACEDFETVKDRLQGLVGQSQFAAKIKLGISGCPRCCAMPKVRDIGVIATLNGWELHFGGNGGYNPRIADLLADHLSTDQLIHHVKVLLELYNLNANQRERSSKFLDRFGGENFKNLFRSSL